MDTKKCIAFLSVSIRRISKSRMPGWINHVFENRRLPCRLSVAPLFTLDVMLRAKFSTPVLRAAADNFRPAQHRRFIRPHCN